MRLLTMITTGEEILHGTGTGGTLTGVGHKIKEYLPNCKVSLWVCSAANYIINPLHHWC